MYSDYEVECMYLGKPFEERTIKREDPISTVTPISMVDMRCAAAPDPFFTMAAAAGAAK